VAFAVWFWSVSWLTAPPGPGRVEPADERVEAGGESLVAVADPDVLAEAASAGKRSAGSDRKNACSWCLVAVSCTRCSLSVVRSLSAKPRV
jgi:hypothetical protein